MPVQWFHPFPGVQAYLFQSSVEFLISLKHKCANCTCTATLKKKQTLHVDMSLQLCLSSTSFSREQMTVVADLKLLQSLKTFQHSCKCQLKFWPVTLLRQQQRTYLQQSDLQTCDQTVSKYWHKIFTHPLPLHCHKLTKGNLLASYPHVQHWQTTRLWLVFLLHSHLYANTITFYSASKKFLHPSGNRTAFLSGNFVHASNQTCGHNQGLIFLAFCDKFDISDRSRLHFLTTLYWNTQTFVLVPEQCSSSEFHSKPANIKATYVRTTDHNKKSDQETSTNSRSTYRSVCHYSARVLHFNLVLCAHRQPVPQFTFVCLHNWPPEYLCTAVWCSVYTHVLHGVRGNMQHTNSCLPIKGSALVFHKTWTIFTLPQKHPESRINWHLRTCKHFAVHQHTWLCFSVLQLLGEHIHISLPVCHAKSHSRPLRWMKTESETALAGTLNVMRYL